MAKQLQNGRLPWGFQEGGEPPRGPPAQKGARGAAARKASTPGPAGRGPRAGPPTFPASSSERWSRRPAQELCCHHHGCYWDRRFTGKHRERPCQAGPWGWRGVQDSRRRRLDSAQSGLRGRPGPRGIMCGPSLRCGLDMRTHIRR